MHNYISVETTKSLDKAEQIAEFKLVRHAFAARVIVCSTPRSLLSYYCAKGFASYDAAQGKDREVPRSSTVVLPVLPARRT